MNEVLITAITVIGGGWFALRLEMVKKQLQPNGSTSLRDAVDRIEADVTQLHKRLDAVEDRIGGRNG